MTIKDEIKKIKDNVYEIPISDMVFQLVELQHLT